MKRLIIIITMFFISTFVISAKEVQNPNVESSLGREILEPTYLKNVVYQSWMDNWFINVCGGGAAFIGKPIGCEDFFGRIKGTFQASLGKWWTPVIGNRLVFQGFTWKSGGLTNQKYRHYHGDLLINLIPLISMNNIDSRWDVIPFVGLGVVDNPDVKTCPFGVNYGIQGGYHITKRLHLTLEFSNVSTFRNSDGQGEDRKFGDNLMSLTAGLSYVIGKESGWKRVIDARPYMVENEKLSAYLAKINQSKKIEDIENMMERGYEKHNNYSGLNSLRSRLQGKGDKKKKEKVGEKTSRFEDEGYIGAPVFFFFEIKSDKLLDQLQLINLDEIARVAQKYCLNIEVVGAADSATGKSETNISLAEKRANFIADYLQKKEVPQNCIEIRFEGGISKYSPKEGNRNAIVRLKPASEVLDDLQM